MKSMVLGANGQDGSYLCELLTASGHEVVAVARQPTCTITLPEQDLHYVQLDLTNHDALREIIHAEQPDDIYHVAAVHGHSGFQYEFVIPELAAVGLVSVGVCLEYLRETGQGQLFFASSSKVFGHAPNGRISEVSAKRADCLYSTIKIAAEHLIDCYRRDHGVKAIIAYLFNHESPRRGAEYFVPKVARALAHGLSGRSEMVTLNSLDFHADWGSAREYMALCMKAMHKRCHGNYVIATGQTLWAADAVKSLFESHDLDYRRFLDVPGPGTSRHENAFVASPERLAEVLGESPRLRFANVVGEICASLE